MNPWKRMEVIGNATLYEGGALDVLAALPNESVQCCVTSPPYWGLRDYGVAGQIGLESTPQEYVEKIVAVFREVRRVLRDDGTLWLNLGDSYAGSGRGGHVSDTSTLQGSIESEQKCREARGSQLAPGLHAAAAAGQIGRAWVPPPNGLKQKDLVGIPWRVAFALQADGWYLRQDIIWSKPNPMPESVRDRCTKAHEYLFLLAKSERYYFDSTAIAEPSNGWNGSTFDGERDLIVRPTTGRRTNIDGNMSERGVTRTTEGLNLKTKEEKTSETRNKRSVWTVATQPYAEAHFATFPPALIEPCILAGCPVGGVVLDPFNGSGTTGEVALKLGRCYVGIELNEQYLSALTLPRITNAQRQERLFA